MKTIANQKFLWPILFAVAVFSVFLIHDITAQNDGDPGPLTPPGAPAPTMNTLGDIFNAVQGSPGKNFGALFAAQALAFDAENNMWVPQNITGADQGVLVESNGNIGVYGTIGAAVWSPDWGWVTQAINTTTQMVGSNRNFAVHNGTQSYVFDNATGTWAAPPAPFAAPVTIAASNGNFCIIGNTARVVAWTSATGFNVATAGGNDIAVIGAD